MHIIKFWKILNTKWFVNLFIRWSIILFKFEIPPQIFDFDLKDDIIHLPLCDRHSVIVHLVLCELFILNTNE